MARTGGEGELPSVAELVNLSQTKPLMIRGDLDALLTGEPAPEPQPDPLAALDAELAAADARAAQEAQEAQEADERLREAPPADRSRRTKPFVLAAGAVVALGLAAVVLFQPQQVGGTAVPPTGATAPAPPPTSSDAVETLSATQAPLTAEVHDSPARTTSAPAAAGRKPAHPPATSTPQPPDDQWREYVSSVISSWQHGRGGHNR
ncbi:hypothetical protein [Amycolatopsis sp. cmx-4-68]|uniref:hypothetical protein n=1 Tax=Amycolatopsis sp. cmx-4-68 TaxID=2790938 RepID=UPI00397C16F2